MNAIKYVEWTWWELRWAPKEKEKALFQIAPKIIAAVKDGKRGIVPADGFSSTGYFSKSMRSDSERTSQSFPALDQLDAGRTTHIELRWVNGEVTSVPVDSPQNVPVVDFR